MNTEFITRPVQSARRHGGKIGGGLGVGALVFLYTTFPQKSDIARVEADNKAQWRAIMELKEDAAASNALIDYFRSPTVTSTNNRP